MLTLRQTALDLFQQAIDRADPAVALANALETNPPKQTPGKTVVVALGKAAVPMMRQAMAILEPVERALVVTNAENHTEIPGARVLAGAHPVPDEHSLNAGRAMRDAVSGLRTADRIIALISGGGSALAVLPEPPIQLQDKAAVNAALLASGLSINEMNLIRQHMSQLKGGGLLRLASPAQITSYILSDVIGDDLRAIASGPTVAPIGSRAEAKQLMHTAGIWEQLPETVRDHFNAPELGEDLPDTAQCLVGSNRHSLDAVRTGATACGFDAQVVSDTLIGDVSDAATKIIEATKSAALSAEPGQKMAFIFGGETTVALNGTGKGGRNQELALRVARDGSDTLPGHWVFLSGGTDGRDGPTDAAGGIVDRHSWATIKKGKADPAALLANNDSYQALSRCSGLIKTGGTGTNVADVQIMLWQADEPTHSNPD
ncbi:DUF4147 domain-containing protein [Phaeobacter sp.]|uniref:glycerate kinase type-2 family protein n=1 Tax=Phaeobacter sp. TaxID=1902409 RepID=UPI0025D7B815|nr:DUF4147 domain-containing protein [Phaeobacter sp.]